jgi:hypothetical protein
VAAAARTSAAITSRHRFTKGRPGDGSPFFFASCYFSDVRFAAALWMLVGSAHADIAVPGHSVQPTSATSHLHWPAKSPCDHFDSITVQTDAPVDLRWSGKSGQVVLRWKEAVDDTPPGYNRPGRFLRFPIPSGFQAGFDTLKVSPAHEVSVSLLCPDRQTETNWFGVSGGEVRPHLWFPVAFSKRPLPSPSQWLDALKQKDQAPTARLAKQMVESMPSLFEKVCSGHSCGGEIAEFVRALRQQRVELRSIGPWQEQNVHGKILSGYRAQLSIGTVFCFADAPAVICDAELFGVPFYDYELQYDSWIRFKFASGRTLAVDKDWKRGDMDAIELVP